MGGTSSSELRKRVNNLEGIVYVLHTKVEETEKKCLEEARCMIQAKMYDVEKREAQRETQREKERQAVRKAENDWLIKIELARKEERRKVEGGKDDFDKELQMAMSQLGESFDGSSRSVIEESTTISPPKRGMVALGISCDEDCILTLSAGDYIIWKRPQKAGEWLPVFPGDIHTKSLRGAYVRFMYFMILTLSSDKPTTKIKVHFYLMNANIPLEIIREDCYFNGMRHKAKDGCVVID